MAGVESGWIVKRAAANGVVQLSGESGEATRTEVEGKRPRPAVVCVSNIMTIFEIMDIASLVLPVYLVYKSIRSKSTMANGLIIISSAVTFMIMVSYGVYTLLDIIRGAETFNIYSIIFIFIMLIKVTLCIVSLLRIRAINNADE